MDRQTAIGMDQTVAKSDTFVESSVDGEAILMHLDEGSFSSLKSTGLRIWSMLDEPRRVDEICDSLMDEFEVEEAVCREHTLAFLAALQGKGLIVVEDSEA